MEDHASRPAAIKYAIYLGVAAYLVGLINLPFAWGGSVELVGLQNQLLLLFAPLLLFVGLYYLSYIRKNWARIILLILLAISFPGYVMSLVGTGSTVYKITQFFQLALFGASFVMFLLKESRAWYKNENAS